MSATVTDRRLLTLREAAAILYFSERTVRRLIADGRLRAVQPAGPGGSIRIPRDELERLVTPKGAGVVTGRITR
jgi:excisionase family DNA binding protein